MAESDWMQMAEDISQIEDKGMTLSESWYLTGSPTESELKTLATLHHDSLDLLDRLSSQLDDSLKQTEKSENRQAMQHAYNLIEELIQSRQADLALLTTMQGDENHPEFGRALAIKERAAVSQANTLKDALRHVQRVH